MLIVDECHRAGAESNARIFESSFGATIGLSATPDRDDDGDKTYVYPSLGSPVFSYPLLRALDDRVLAPLRSINLYVDFTPDERSLWDATAEALTNAMRSLRWEHPDLDFDAGDIFARIGRLAENEDPAALRVVALLSNRRELLSESEGRRQCISALFNWLTTNSRKTIAFHETIAGAQNSLRELESRRVRAVLDHSQMKPKDRQESLAKFGRPTTQVLVAVRSLDEGLDVPDADVAMILAGSRSKRQRIQRVGRVVRPKAGKEALAITVLVRGTPEETVTGSRDDQLLGPTRVEHHRWPETAADDALEGLPSSYQPARRRAPTRSRPNHDAVGEPSHDSLSRDLLRHTIELIGGRFDHVIDRSSQRPPHRFWCIVGDDAVTIRRQPLFVRPGTCCRGVRGVHAQVLPRSSLHLEPAQTLRELLYGQALQLFSASRPTGRRQDNSRKSQIVASRSRNLSARRRKRNGVEVILAPEPFGHRGDLASESSSARSLVAR